MRRFGVSIGLVSVLLGGAPLAAQTDSPAVVEELARLNATLGELRDLLARQLEAQSLDLMLKRTELASQEASQLEARLRSAEARARSLEDEKASMETRLEELERRSRDEGLESDEQTRSVVRQFEAEIERVERRLAEARGDVAQIAGRLDRKLEDLRAWQDLVDRRLSGQ